MERLLPEDRRARSIAARPAIVQREADSIAARQQAEAERLAAQTQLEEQRWEVHKAARPSLNHPYPTRYEDGLKAQLIASATPIPAPAPVPKRRPKNQAVCIEGEAPH